MTIHFELWNDQTNNLIDEFDTMEQAFDEVRWRIAVQGGDAPSTLSLLRLDVTGAVEAVIAGDELIRQARETVVASD